MIAYARCWIMSFRIVDAHSIEYQHRKCELRKELGFENLDESER